MTRKAMLGCGFAHDIAEDTGWAMVMASPYQQGALSQLASYLSNYTDYHSEAPMRPDSSRIMLDGNQLYLDAQPHEMLVFNGMICDWLTASEGVNSDAPAVTLRLSYMPFVFLGHLLWAECQYQKQIEIGHNGHYFSPKEMLEALADSHNDRCGELGEYSLKIKSRAEAPTSPKAESIEIDETGWHILSEFAARSYVPESDASRLAGAGAGLTDND